MVEVLNNYPQLGIREERLTYSRGNTSDRFRLLTDDGNPIYWTKKDEATRAINTYIALPEDIKIVLGFLTPSERRKLCLSVSQLITDDKLQDETLDNLVAKGTHVERTFRAVEGLLNSVEYIIDGAYKRFQTGIRDAIKDGQGEDALILAGRAQVAQTLVDNYRRTVVARRVDEITAPQATPRPKTPVQQELEEHHYNPT